MKTKEAILENIKKQGVVKSADLVRRFGISRQAAAKHLRELVAEGKLTKTGSTRLACYVPYDVRQVRPREGKKQFAGKYQLQGLDEGAVFREAELKMGLSKALSPKPIALPVMRSQKC